MKTPDGPNPHSQGVIQVWDTVTGKAFLTLRSPESPGNVPYVNGVAFLPDNTTLIASCGGKINFWDLRSGQIEATLNSPRGMIATMIDALALSPDGRTLAASSVDAPVFVWDVAGTLEPRRRRLSNDELQRYWTALAGEDAPAAFQAIRRLATAHEQTLPFLREHLKPVPPPDRKRVRQLVGMLDSADFPRRQKATEDLEKLADDAVSTLRQFLAKEKPTLEMRRRLQKILEAMENKPETLHAIRSVEVLEWIATPDAFRLIDKLAKGAVDARLTREVVAARNRLRK